MATTTLTSKSITITVSGTSEHDIDFDDVLTKGDNDGYALVTMISGTAVQFDPSGVTIDSNSITLHSSGNDTKEMFEIKRGVKLKYKGGAGSEVFNLNIHSK